MAFAMPTGVFCLFLAPTKYSLSDSSCYWHKLTRVKDSSQFPCGGDQTLLASSLIPKGTCDSGRHFLGSGKGGVATEI